VARTGAWRYSFIYELAHRHYPDLPGRARPITHRAAREKMTALYFDAVGAATVSDVRRLFQWKAREAESTLQDMVGAGQLHPGYAVEGHTGEHYIATKLLIAF
jgi:hypothetical protein